MTDASAYCIGGVIGHMVGKEFKPIAYGSKILSETEQRYPSFKTPIICQNQLVTSLHLSYLNMTSSSSNTQTGSSTEKTYYRVPHHPHLPRKGVQLNKPNYRVPHHPIMPKLGYFTQLQDQYSWVIFIIPTSKTPFHYSFRRKTWTF